MQNLTTTLKIDVLVNRHIRLPAGDARFNWVDVEDVGAVAASAMCRLDEYRGRVLEVTGSESLGFAEATATINRAVGADIRYSNRNPVTFILDRLRRGEQLPWVMVVTLLHFLPRIQGTPPLTATVQEVTGRAPRTLAMFARDNRHLFLGNREDAP